MLERTITFQAAMLGINDIFYVSAVIFIVIIPLIWIIKPSKGGAGAAEASAAH
jgi:DHA2 family multidrug resistance protein